MLMANEGSTKPTYSELEAENLRVRGLLQRRDQDWRDLIQDAIGQWGGPQFKYFNEAMARIWDAKKNFDKGLDLWGDPLDEPTNSETTVSSDNHDVHKGNVGIEPAEKSVEYSSQNPTFPQPSSLVSQGAESADIGKLDGTDKSGSADDEVYGKIAKHFRGRINCTYTPEQVARCIEELRDKKFIKAGSAETGGENAAHESEIAELSLEAWKYGAYIGEWDATQAEKWRAEADVIETKLHRKVSELAESRGLTHKHFAHKSLAESSLSSPPHPDDE